MGALDVRRVAELMFGKIPDQEWREFLIEDYVEELTHGSAGTICTRDLPVNGRTFYSLNYSGIGKVLHMSYYKKSI